MFFTAIDTGCTKIASAVIDENGTIFRKDHYTRENDHDKDSTMQIYGGIVERYRHEYPISAVGVGVGGRVDVNTGMYNFGTAAISGWDGVNIISELQDICSLPVAIENDSKVAIIGECWKGATQGYETVLGVMIGTGLGGGYLYNNEMVYGSRYGAGELGHFILYPDGKKCLCGQYGCAEMYCSGTALWQSYNEMRTFNSMSINETQPLNPISSGYEFFDRLNNGDTDAKKCIDMFSRDLAVSLVSLANLYDPQVILIGGGITDTKEHWWDSMMEYYIQQGAAFVRDIPIIASTLGNDAPLLGAAKIACDLIKLR